MVDIRRARPEDAEALRGLYIEAAKWIREARGFNQWREETFAGAYIEQFIGSRDVFAAVLDGKPVGCFSVEWEDEEIWGEQFHRNAGYVHRLVVSREHRGQAIGGKMLDWAAEYIGSQGKSWLRLDCMADNPPLNRYYERQGMSFKGRFDAGAWSANLYERRIEPSEPKCR